MTDYREGMQLQKAYAEITRLESLIRRTWMHGHFPWCAKNSQMPMQHNRSYYYPQDWDAWRATVKCTCDAPSISGFEDDGEGKHD